MTPEHVGDVFGFMVFPGGDASADGSVGDVDALVAQLLVEHAGIRDLAGKRDAHSSGQGYGLMAAPPVVKRMVPEPRSSIASTTAVAAATAPKTLNSNGPRTS